MHFIEGQVAQMNQYRNFSFLTEEVSWERTSSTSLGTEPHSKENGQVNKPGDQSDEVYPYF